VIPFVHPQASLHYLTLALLAPVLLAAACLAALAFNEAWLAGKSPTTLASNQITMLCVSMRLSRDWRAAVWWGAAVSTRTGRMRRPFIQPRLACGLVPWQSWLPSTGALQTSD